MNNKQIESVLEQAIEKGFLEQVEYIFDNEKEYKKSEFFKKTRIPLITLYEKYYMTKSQKRLLKDLTEVVKEFDIEFLVIKIEQLLEQFKDSEDIQDFFEKVVSFFNPEKLAGLQEQAAEMLKKINIG